MKLKSYLTETSQRTQKIDIDEARSFIEQNCKKALLSTSPIWRGIGSFVSRAGIADSSQFTRKSLNTKNYYTLMIDNLPEWSKYPKRSKSFIGVTDKTVAREHGGSLFVALPVDGTKIGICPKSDIWDSFDYRRGMNTFNDELEHLFDFAFGLDLHDDTWNNFVKDLKKLDDYINTRAGYSDFDSNLHTELWLNYYKVGNPLLKTLSQIVTPKNFMLKTIGDTLPKGKEVWWSGKTVFIQELDYIKLKQDIK